MMSAIADSLAPEFGARGQARIDILESNVDEQRWDAFVKNQLDGTFYHLSGWRRIIHRHLGHKAYYLFAEDNGQIRSVLPLVRVKSWLFGDALISVPFLVYGGAVGGNEGERNLLIDYAVDLAEDLGVDYIELRNRVRERDWQCSSRYVTFRRQIEPTAEANMLAVPRKQRAMIRKGIKCNLEAELDEDADRLHRALSECKRNLGTPFFSRRYLQSVKDEFQSDCEIMTITHGQKLVCSVMSFKFRDEILPYYGGGGAIARRFAGNDFMYWKVMERACNEGFKIFDFGRSQQGSGAYKFKKHWGFEPQPLYHEYHLIRGNERPILSPSNSKYQLAVKMWSKLPLLVARLAGPPLARRLG